MNSKLEILLCLVFLTCGIRTAHSLSKLFKSSSSSSASSVSSFSSVSSVPSGDKKKIFESIKEIAKASSCANYTWPGRGHVPLGYIEGVAVTYAKNLCDLKNKKPTTLSMIIPNMASSSDAFAYYGINPSGDVARLRSLFSLTLGLGVRESSGRYCCGRDASATNTSSTTAEAGAWQTSYNALSGPVRQSLYMAYKIDQSECNLDIFKQGVSCKASDLTDWGFGEGFSFQVLEKACPTFAAELAALDLRYLRKHYGPINTKAARIVPECTSMLQMVENLVSSSNYCSL